MTDNVVKILIKAPNQLVDDQTIHCERSWTVRRLKQHLSDVYPCKPHPDGQKLIYSGQLLLDEAVLSDVLRSYDGLENNTIHLVCSVKEAAYKCRSTPKPTPKPNESGLRQRQMATNTRTPVTLPTMNRNPRDVVQQTLLFQQAYLNYMAQFSQMINDGRIPTIDNSFFQNYQNNLLNQNNTLANNANRDIPDNDRDNEMEDVQEEGRLRDWLEWFYLGSRMFLLVSVVYFYSSPERFILVIAMALILINIDVFRWRRNRQLQPVNPVAPPPPPVIQEVTTDYVEPPDDSDIEPMNWFNVAWSFMKTFFLSLVPENRDT